MQETLLYKQTLPVRGEYDVVVAGGSCTGVFAAIAAARAGARVALVEAQNRLGGTATCGLVCYWHSLMDVFYREQIICGLTQELLERLKRRDLVVFWDEPNPSWYANFNTEEMCCELDEMVREAKIVPLLHTRVADVLREDGRVTGLVLAGKDGLSLVRGTYFIDATGDADVVRFAGGKIWRNEVLQTATACVKFSNISPEARKALGHLIHEVAEKY
ncbi:MAG: FAD-dependent oxidoreductase, partial [Victivallales bacterium]|nr:FAD-dependent oxidoreductase [Victivallales bacterium]